MAVARSPPNLIDSPMQWSDADDHVMTDAPALLLPAPLQPALAAAVQALAPSPRGAAAQLADRVTEVDLIDLASPPTSPRHPRQRQRQEHVQHGQAQQPVQEAVVVAERRNTRADVDFLRPKHLVFPKPASTTPAVQKTASAAETAHCAPTDAPRGPRRSERDRGHGHALQQLCYKHHIHRASRSDSALAFIMESMDIREPGRRESGGRREFRGGRGGGGRGHFNPGRKRGRDDEDDFDGRPQRQRREEPAVAKLRRGLLNLAESPMRTQQDEAKQLGQAIATNFEDEEVKGGVIDLAVQMCLEQPMKIPFVAATIQYANESKPEVALELLDRAGAQIGQAVQEGQWRTFKLLLRLFACLQSMLDGDGVFPVLEQAFSAAADLQTGSSEDTLGLELVKIILLTLPYAVANSNGALDEKATEFLTSTEVIASNPHPIEALAAPYVDDTEETPVGNRSLISLLQRQLDQQAKGAWTLECIPRPYQPSEVTNADGAEKSEDAENGDAPEVKGPAPKHALPAISVPNTPNPGPKPLFPESYISIYADQDVETVPRTDNIAASLIRDALVDTINILDFNRNATAKYVIEIDCFWAPDTFVKRATPYDKIRENPGEYKSTWKPEDMAVDAAFSQILALPVAEHKLVYYHAVITEACKVAPAAIAPSLGRAIRFLFRHVDEMDLELSYRFLDWFAHHLSNFDFRWKWSEWTQDIDLSNIHPKKAFILAALDKEIRLSFAKRIREGLPGEYHALIPEGKEKDTPDFKYNSDQTPYAQEGRAILQLLRKKASEEEVQQHIDAIHSQATEHGVADPLVPSTDAYVTAICFIGSKSLSHVLSCIERCKERLLALGQTSEAARRQVITSVVAYWRDQPGTAVNIVDKLLNYTILSPESVVGWALGPDEHGLGNGAGLSDGWRYEMVAGTVYKVTHRVRQIAAARIQAKTQGLPEEQVQMIEEALSRERDAMRALFTTIEDSVGGVAAGAADGLIEAEGGPLDEGDAALVRAWGGRWARVFRRKLAVEETIVGEMAMAVSLAAAPDPQPEGEVETGDPELQQQQQANGAANGDVAAAVEQLNGDANADMDIA